MSQMHTVPPGQQADSCSTLLPPITWMRWMLSMLSAQGACSKSRAQVCNPFLHGHVGSFLEKKRNEKKRKDYAFWHPLNGKPSIIPGCPDWVLLMSS